MQILVTLTTAFYGPQHKFNYEFSSRAQLADFMASYLPVAGDVLNIKVVQ